jgi:phosphoenolpyruvate carboxykinase (ATP)
MVKLLFHNKSYRSYHKIKIMKASNPCTAHLKNEFLKIRLPGLITSQNIYYQLPPEKLISQSVERREGVLSDNGALVINTGKFTGRSPKDRFIVEDALTAGTINWNEFNQPIAAKYFDILFEKVIKYLSKRDLWIRDCFVCARKEFRLAVRVINENPCCNLFSYNMFLRPEKKDLKTIHVDWHLIQAPHFFASPDTDGVPHKNFVLINFSKKIILIGGTQYTGEIKKAVFTILNYLLPLKRNVLTMHCAANIGKQGDTAIFFGLSGTGKTTLSTDPARMLLGDDEHGWDGDSLFNFEGGCYAKVINLDRNKEPCIYKAIRFGALAENVNFIKGSKAIDFNCAKITENTRASYPTHYIDNALMPAVAKAPANIFFLTADAFGVLPPISRLTAEQAIYYFLSGYTAKVAGTETGITAPKPTFSACFGAPFIPLRPTIYSWMLSHKLKETGAKVWLVNTGWYGGMYGEGKRMPLAYTRAMITAALTGKLNNVPYVIQPVFNLSTPASCPGVPPELLNPKTTWQDKSEWLKTSCTLARYFKENFKKYAGSVSKEILLAGPQNEAYYVEE